MFRVAISGIEFWTLDEGKARELIVSDGRELGERVVLDLGGGPFSHVVSDRGLEDMLGEFYARGGDRYGA